jgi:site-specific recombinase XerD
MEWCGTLGIIPFKRARQITYLEQSEMEALLAAPDRRTPQGQRDYALLLFLYNTGARADEVAQLTIGNLELAQTPTRDLSSAQIHGKGNKLRRCPLWPHTANVLSALLNDRAQHEHVFLNRCGRPITRFGIHTMMERYVKRVSTKLPALATKRVSPHSLRHTTATHLLRAGVDINTIRAWLGHVSIDTTNIYAETDLEMKAKALATCEVKETKRSRRWKEDKGLMTFLQAL